MTIAEGAAIALPSPPSDENINNTPDLFKPGHVAQISLRTLHDVIQAKSLLKSANSPTRPVLSDLEITFRAVYYKPDGATVVRIARRALRPVAHIGHERALSACLGLRGPDLTHTCIPARMRNAFDKAATDGEIWIARLVAFSSKDLQPEGYARQEYYKVFKEIALRKDGKDWTVADLEGVFGFFVDRRGR